jgi:hypothetical protein
MRFFGSGTDSPFRERKGTTRERVFLRKAGSVTHLLVAAALVGPGCAMRGRHHHETHRPPAVAADPHVAMFMQMKDPRDVIAGPHDIDGYTAAGWWIMREGNDPDRALALLHEGIRANPESFQLYYLVGEAHLTKAKHGAGGDLAHAGPEVGDLLEEAREAYERAALLGLKERSEADPGAWSAYKETDLRGAARMAVLLQHRFGDPVRARTRAAAFSSQFGSDPVLDLILE